MADPLGFVIAAQRSLPGPVPGQLLDLDALGIVLADQMIGDDHHLARIPDIDAELLEHGREAPRAAGVVHHGQVDVAGDDVPRANLLAAGGPARIFSARVMDMEAAAW